MPGKQELMKDSKNVSSERSSVLQVSCVCPPKEPATIIATWLVLTNYNYWRLILTTIQSARELLLLSHPSRVRLCATPQIAAHKASLSLGFSRQEHWSGLPFPSPMYESEKWKVKVKSLSHVRLFATPWTAAYQAPLSMGFSRQEYWSGVPY